jgi:hypothetical protein
LKRTSAILKALSERDDDRILLGDIARQSGSRAHGFGLLLFALPETLPLPLPSLSIVLAVPLILISGHLTLFGEGSRIPKQVRDRSLPASVVKKTATYIAPVFEALERFACPRFEALAARERLLGAVCLLLSVILLLPIPFGNLVPAACLAGIAFGMLQRDGAVVAVGLLGTLACFLVLIYLASMAGSLFA